MYAQLGETKRGFEIGKKGTNYWMWCACPKCGKQRWVYLKHGEPVSKHCVQCREYVKTPARIAVYESRRGIPRKPGIIKSGKESHFYKNGRFITVKGYISVLLTGTDEFYLPMSTHAHRVLEHRLVMAKKLGRCLQSWELVHHKGIRYSGIRNKSDNLEDNLELTLKGQHTKDHSKGYRDGYEKGLADGRSKLVKSLIYLWTRDAEMPVSKETEDYIIDHLQKISIAKKATFSDKARADMATGILK